MLKQLEGVRVLESATLFNGDHLGTLLGDLGADVIKIESPFQGDYLRDFLGQITPHHSPAHVQVNKNKRSVTLNLRTDEGKDLFWRLLDTADVFVDGNAGPGSGPPGHRLRGATQAQTRHRLLPGQRVRLSRRVREHPDARADDERAGRVHADGDRARTA